MTNFSRQAQHISPSAPDRLEKRQQFAGRATFYDVGLGACGDVNIASEYIVALNLPQWGGDSYPGPNCNKIITITYGGKSINAVIKDQCPTCTWGSLDLSRGLFNAFASEDLGIFDMTWVWNDGSAHAPPPPEPVPAPPPEPVSSSAAAWTPEAQFSWSPPPPSSIYSPPPEPSTWFPPPPPSSFAQEPSSSTLATSTFTTYSVAYSSSSLSVSESSSQVKPSSTSSKSAVIPASTVLPADILQGAGNLVLINQLVVNLGNLVVHGAQNAQN